MAKFNKRTTAPAKDNKYYYKDNIFYQCGYGMPNCTCYAWGRWYELLGTKPKLCTSNAENWYNYKDGYTRGKTPKLGAIIVWAKGKVSNASDGAGHVAVVEEIHSDGSITTSNSAWGGTNFYTKKISNGYALSGFTFLGFIYPSINFEEDKPVEPSAETYSLVCDVKVYSNAANAKNKQSSVATYSKGSYYIYKKYDGMINITKKKGSAGGWINPSDNNGSSTPSTSYYKKYGGKSTSLDSILESIGVPSSYRGSWKNRLKLAAKNGITLYVGSASQNKKLIDLAKQGKLKKV